MNDLLIRLGMEPISQLFDQNYEAIKDEEKLPDWLTEAFLLETLKEFPFFTKNRELVISALPTLLNNPDHVLFVKVLYRMLGIRKHQKEVFPGLRFPPDFGLAPIFPLLARARENYRELRRRGADEEILQATAARIDNSITDSIRIAGKPVLSGHYFRWLTVNCSGKLLSVDRFDFELRDSCHQNVRAFRHTDGREMLLMTDGLQVHRSGLIMGSANCTDAEGSFETQYLEIEDAFMGNPVENCLVQRQPIQLSKNDWTCVYQPGDPLISVHIPSSGSFDPDTVNRSLRHGKELIQRLYPETPFRGFCCGSWLLSPDLSKLLKPTANILHFGGLFTRYPIGAKGMDIFRFVFQQETSDLSTVDWDALPRETSLARALADYYRSGNRIYETGGLILFPDAIGE